MSTNSRTADASPESVNFKTPWVGTLLTVLSGLAFCAVCMVLPLVGKAAKTVAYYEQNERAFVVVLLVSLILAALAAFSKLSRRAVDGSPLPIASFLLIGIDLFLFVALYAGWLAI